MYNIAIFHKYLKFPVGFEVVTVMTEEYYLLGLEYMALHSR